MTTNIPLTTAAGEGAHSEVVLDSFRRQLRQRSIAAAVLSSESNVSYVSGLRAPSFRSHARPIMVLVPADGPPTMICSASQEPNARSWWAHSIRTFSGFEDEAVIELEEVLRAQGFQSDTVAFELGTEQRMGLTPAGFQRLCARLTSMRVVDGAAVIWGARMVKTDHEIRMLKAAGAVNGAAFDAAIEAARAGATELDVHSAWARTALSASPDAMGYLAMYSGADDRRRVSGMATPRRLLQGDILWLDGGPRHFGYWSDITRMAVVDAAPTEEQSSSYRFSRETAHDVISFARPGMEAADLYSHCKKRFDAAGIPLNSASRVGHGLGVELTEPPSLIESDHTVLQPGMVLAIEPGVMNSSGYFNVEENFLITDGGAERISPAAPPILPNTKGELP